MAGFISEQWRSMEHVPWIFPLPWLMTAGYDRMNQEQQGLMGQYNRRHLDCFNVWVCRLPIFMVYTGVIAHHWSLGCPIQAKEQRIV